MNDCVFCKILSGELPSHKIYEDDHSLAFLDIDPITEGHAVVIPKKHTEQLWDLEDQDYLHVMHSTQRVAKLLREKFNAFRVGLIVEGMEVAHAHCKIMPLNEGMKQTLNAHVKQDPNHEELATLAKKLRT